MWSLPSSIGRCRNHHSSLPLHMWLHLQLRAAGAPSATCSWCTFSHVQLVHLQPHEGGAPSATCSWCTFSHGSWCTFSDVQLLHSQAYKAAAPSCIYSCCTLKAYTAASTLKLTKYASWKVAAFFTGSTWVLQSYRGKFYEIECNFPALYGRAI